MAEEIKKEETKAKKVNVERWKARQLKVINEMSNKAKAKVLAERVLSN